MYELGAKFEKTRGLLFFNDLSESERAAFTCFEYIASKFSYKNKEVLNSLDEKGNLLLGHVYHKLATRAYHNKNYLAAKLAYSTSAELGIEESQKALEEMKEKKLIK